MSKDHFPVNDKTIADVNAANARAYSGDAEDSTSEQRTERKLKNPKKLSGVSPTTFQNVPLEQEHRNKTAKILKEIRGLRGKSSGDHVREFKQEHGEDAKSQIPPPDKRPGESKLATFERHKQEYESGGNKGSRNNPGTVGYNDPGR